MVTKILIVDDEKIEREGLKRLIREYNLELDVAEAPNGERALEYLEKHAADILLTDIRMRKMDGLQLGKSAREIYPKLKIVIFSAYDEFEYAKRAIDISAVQYLLKPIDVEEFLRVINGLMQQCAEERMKREHDAELTQLYGKWQAYNRQKALVVLLLDNASREAKQESLMQAGIDLTGKWILPFLIDVETPFFLQRHHEFELYITEGPLSMHCELLPLNERQSLLLHMTDEQPLVTEQERLANELAELFMERYQEKAMIVSGRPLEKMEEVAAEYTSMEETLESKFFLFDRSVLYTWKTEDGQGESAKIEIDAVMERISRQIAHREFFLIEQEIKSLFKNVQATVNSAIYTKYVASQIVKALVRADEIMHSIRFQQIVESIYNAGNVLQIIDYLLEPLNEIERRGQGEPQQSRRKVIQDVVRYIHEHYMHDIGLEVIAGRVFLSPGYLSQLFKKEMGQSMMKYITNYRLEKAKDLLSKTNLKVQDVGVKVGYPNLSYFCMLFVNHYGVSPSGFREDGGNL